MRSRKMYGNKKTFVGFKLDTSLKVPGKCSNNTMLLVVFSVLSQNYGVNSFYLLTTNIIRILQGS
jgi:hypothetical protein